MGECKVLQLWLDMELPADSSLAFWIMDDGQQVKRGGVTLCTDSFDLEEVNIDNLKQS